MKRIVAVLFACAMTAGALSAAEKKLMHCFAFTTIEQASAADWDAFRSATAELPKKIPGLTDVWYGKLRSPMRTPNGARSYGVCMEFKDEAALKTYADHEAHKQWQAAYEKVRQPGTTTFDILGE
jgi:hypothetical protein